ncbi:MAG: efflux RND transporter permease subunit, partial [Thermoguttaceae bacterium]
MLNSIIRFSLQHRMLVAAVSLLLVFYGSWQITRLPIDVFPNLDRPRVTIMTEAPGMSPEAVETLITIPLETALNGATGVQAVRTGSGVGVSVIDVDFDWGTDIYDDRQIVTERLAVVVDQLPEGITPQLAPVSSVMGQIMIIGMWVDAPTTSPDGATTSPMELRTLADWVVRRRLVKIPGVSQIFVM